ncbi:citrate/2-methylcitrate synthase [Dokdonella koreensis]|uniref:citrate synthase (unknown stereospecificity) n=1 Tax=Dokdonella koreensis DS-123 TaxID=1300342 RepID=A0A167GMS2_9GAMM|nr:citrate synthase family protein [Dokdonella koreensis]ANB16752.1 Citrate synthase [Dokdonella koreensis DS-123]
MSDGDYIPAGEATALLGISTATLYAYVSRGLVESRPGEDHRSRVYRRQDVERLASRKRAGRGAARGAAQSLDRGLPVMETRISLIRPDGPYYRGQSAIGLVRDGAGLEDAARILWDCGDRDPFSHAPAEDWPASVAAIVADTRLPPLERTLAAIPLLALASPHSFNASPIVRRETAALLLRQNAALLVGGRAGTRPVHRVLAQRWKRGDARLDTLVRAALVLCADHELNVSAFAARVVASTGAHLHATVCAGLAALSGPRHGGATTRAYVFIRESLQAGAVARFVSERWRRGDDLPGFGHALYPDGDPRARELLALLHAATPRPRLLDSVAALAACVEETSGQAPNIDFTLAAICLVHELAPEAALTLFAAGRVAGWLAHALEQQALGALIRPRARYTGRMPPAGDPAT